MKRPVKCTIWGADCGHQSSISLDRVVREALCDMAGRKGCTVNDLLSEIDPEREGATFATATRSYIAAYYRAMIQAATQGDAAKVAL
jgi:predicted DNA-binding ribbon-helix-helix protein